jgi:hypothetical protein
MSVETALKDISKQLGVKPNDLSKLINFESRWNPLAVNPISGAKGLIQFTDSTARSMGFSSASDIVLQYPDAEAQLRGPVLKYLSQFKPFAAPYPQSLYLSVFYPAYRYYPLNAEFSDTIKMQNPGINFVGDYVAKVEGGSFKRYSAFGFFIPLLLGIGAIVYNFIKNTRRSI